MKMKGLKVGIDKGRTRELPMDMEMRGEMKATSLRDCGANLAELSVFSLYMREWLRLSMIFGIVQTIDLVRRDCIVVSGRRGKLLHGIVHAGHRGCEPVGHHAICRTLTEVTSETTLTLPYLSGVDSQTWRGIAVIVAVNHSRTMEGKSEIRSRHCRA